MKMINILAANFETIIRKIIFQNSQNLKSCEDFITKVHWKVSWITEAQEIINK